MRDHVQNSCMTVFGTWAKLTNRYPCVQDSTSVPKRKPFDARMALLSSFMAVPASKFNYSLCHRRHGVLEQGDQRVSERQNEGGKVE